MGLFITKAKWIAFDVYGAVLATNTLDTNTEVLNVKNPQDMVSPGAPLYNTLRADALANPTVSSYVNPIPPTVLDPSEIAGYAIPQIFYYIVKMNEDVP